MKDLIFLIANADMKIVIRIFEVKCFSRKLSRLNYEYFNSKIFYVYKCRFNKCSNFGLKLDFKSFAFIKLDYHNFRLLNK